MREMKASGIEWIEDIPIHWEVHPLYYYFAERKNKNTLGAEQNLLSLSYGRIVKKDIDTVGGLLPRNYNGYNIIEAIVPKSHNKMRGGTFPIAVFSRAVG